jgi:serine/threonine-protein kinase HipA
MARRAEKVNAATVMLWGREAGAVAWDNARGIGSFQYTPDFIQQGLEISPIVMPLGPSIFSFRGLNHETFRGLPGLLADALPDRYGNRMIEVWLAQQGRSPESFSPVERLCYMGSRGMGALEFRPAIGPRASKAVPFEVSELTSLAAEVLRHRTEWAVNLRGSEAKALTTIIRVGTSAGGNRAKAVIAWNPMTQEVRSGQVPCPPGFEPWILKFDGINDSSLGDPQHFGRIEYAYHRMTTEAGIEMMPCRLLEEGGRAHFMTRRFDRDNEGGKIHMQSLCAIAHYDFNAAGEYSYEQAMGVIQQLDLGYPAMQEMFRRMVFNVIARNQDDHTRNIAFLMGKNGSWRLSPAFDVVWACNPSGEWTNRHQMSINRKRDGFERADLLAVAHQYGIKNASAIIEQVETAVGKWSEFAEKAGVSPDLIQEISKTHRLRLV